jgi:hypothetical protein
MSVKAKKITVVCQGVHPDKIDGVVSTSEDRGDTHLQGLDCLNGPYTWLKAAAPHDGVSAKISHIPGEECNKAGEGEAGAIHYVSQLLGEPAWEAQDGFVKEHLSPLLTPRPPTPGVLLVSIDTDVKFLAILAFAVNAVDHGKTFVYVKGLGELPYSLMNRVFNSIENHSDWSRSDNQASAQWVQKEEGSQAYVKSILTVVVYISHGCDFQPSWKGGYGYKLMLESMMSYVQMTHQGYWRKRSPIVAQEAGNVVWRVNVKELSLFFAYMYFMKNGPSFNRRDLSDEALQEVFMTLCDSFGHDVEKIIGHVRRTLLAALGSTPAILPTCEQLHLFSCRSDYVLEMWQLALTSSMGSLPNPLGRGWGTLKGKCANTQRPSIEDIGRMLSPHVVESDGIKHLYCMCRPGAKCKGCSCRKADRRCSLYCKCICECSNVFDDALKVLAQAEGPLEVETQDAGGERGEEDEVEIMGEGEEGNAPEDDMMTYFVPAVIELGGEEDDEDDEGENDDGIREGEQDDFDGEVEETEDWDT